LTIGPDDPTRASDAASPEARPALPSLPIGTRIGPYRLLQRLGEGGMGEVWLAEQEAPLRRRVALKLLKRGLDTAQVVARFESERQALALMDHPAIAQVHDTGETPDGRPFFAMEYVAGEPLNVYCDRRKQTTPERLELFLEICAGVQHAHHKGIVHRDLKPSNILVAERDGKAVPKIIDFGVAKAMGAALTDRTLHTWIGGIIGTPEYMSPEQADRSGVDIDTRSDVYSLGVVLYELLTGGLPFESAALRGASVDELRRIIGASEPQRPSARLSTLGGETADVAARRRTEPGSLLRELRGDLDWITLRALEKDRARRYESPAHLAADIRRHLANEPVLAGPPSVAYKAGKFVRRHRIAVAAATTVLAALVAFSIYVALQNRRIAAERDRANAIAEFLTGAFRVSDPSENRGRTVTAREILDGAARRLETELATQAELRGRLGATIGQVYVSLGLHADAEPMLQKAIGALTEARGRDDRETLQARNELGVLYYESGRAEEAAGIHRETLERRRRAFGDEDKDTLNSIGNLANAVQALGDLAEAERLQRELLAVRRRVSGPDDIDTIRTLNNLASALQYQEEYAESAALFEEAWKALSRTQGADHPDTLLVATNVAASKAMSGDPEGAIPVFEAALEGQRRVLGPDHPDTLYTQVDLGETLMRAGRLAEAESTTVAALDSHVRVFGETEVITIRTMDALAKVYGAKGDVAALRKTAARRLAALRVRAEKPEAGSADKNRYAFAALTIEPADVREPARALELALAAERQTQGNDPAILDTLALAWLRNGDRSKAEAAIRRALDLVPAAAPERKEYEARLAEVLE
jgi:non-specific serine/threonine protein kinase/serine/threonine-protein kinase